jgi:hypothetical protein
VALKNLLKPALVPSKVTGDAGWDEDITGTTDSVFFQ